MTTITDGTNAVQSELESAQPTTPQETPMSETETATPTPETTAAPEATAVLGETQGIANEILELTPNPQGGEPFSIEGQTTVVPAGGESSIEENKKAEGGLNILLIAGILIAVAVVATCCAFVLSSKRASICRKKTVNQAAKGAKQRTVDTEKNKTGAWITLGNAQNQGARAEQQDSFCCTDIYDENLLRSKGALVLLADGMGGLADGKIVSNTLVRAMNDTFMKGPVETNPADTLLRLLKRGRVAVEAVQGEEKSGSTLIAALIQNRKLYFLSVGDSRISLYRKGGLIQLNREHVYGRQLDDMTINGEIDMQTAKGNKQRQALTSYIGKNGAIDIDRNIRPIELYPGDKVVLMSDGVYGSLRDAEMVELLKRPAEEAALEIEKAVMEKHVPKQDNMTIIVLQIEQ